MADSPCPLALAQLSRADKIDALCDRFEQDWKAGRQPAVEAYLSRCEEAERPAAGTGDAARSRSSCLHRPGVARPLKITSAVLHNTPKSCAM